jgi:hypothetical protein
MSKCDLTFYRMSFLEHILRLRLCFDRLRRCATLGIAWTLM